MTCPNLSVWVDVRSIHELVISCIFACNSVGSKVVCNAHVERNCDFVGVSLSTEHAVVSNIMVHVMHLDHER